MNISNAQARDAFYKAADVIERNPDSYDFGRVLVGDDGCPACMWGMMVVLRVCGGMSGECLGLM